MATEKRLFDENIPIIKEYFNNRLIRLDDALRAITPENATSLPDDQLEVLLTARKKLKSVHIIDAVPVVRCKNCVRGDQCANRPSYIYCMEHFKLVDKDDYCSYGEKESRW